MRVAQLVEEFFKRSPLPPGVEAEVDEHLKKLFELSRLSPEVEVWTDDGKMPTLVARVEPSSNSDSGEVTDYYLWH